MDIETKLDLIKQVGEEIVTEEDLKTLLETKQHPIAYDGFEPSAVAHIAQGILRTINVNKILKAGCKFKIYAADWHAWTNLKFGGDLHKIQVAGDYQFDEDGRPGSSGTQPLQMKLETCYENDESKKQ